MGVVLCTRHGLRGIAFVCPHVNEAILKETPLPQTLRATADLNFNAYKMNATLCLECAAIAASDGRGLDRFGGQGLDWFFELKSEPVCSECLADAERVDHCPHA